MDEAIQVSCIIDKLPPSWKYFKHTLKHLKEELTLVRLGSHLRIEESLRMRDNDKPKGNNVVGPSVVNMVEHNNSSRYNDNKGKHKHHDNTKADPNKKPKVTCWKCRKPGHLKKDCKGVNVVNKANGSGTNGLVDGSSNSLKGETVHVCKDRCWFKTYESLNDGSILHMGNESTTLVHGRGYVDLKSSSGKIISLLNIVNDNIGSAFMSTSKLNDSIIWHARLGHVYFKRMQEMSKDGLIPAFYMDTEKCKTCMLNKITKKPFQNVNRETKVLELIHSDLTESRVLGAVVRLPDPKWKSLGERGIECIFFGYAEHSKAFRFYVIEPNDSVSINSITESRDAIFDDNRFSSVPRPSLKIPNGTEGSGGSVVPEEVTEEVVHQPEPELRKSKRNRSPKDSRPEFQLNLIEGTRDEVSDQHSYCFNVKDDPKTFDEAMNPNWDLQFELMCVATDFAVGAVLGQKDGKNFHPIYFASKTLNAAQQNYTITEKELMAVVFAFDKFRSYLVLSKTIMHTDHSALRHLFKKQDVKPHLIRWILLLQEFDIKIKDIKGTENVAADHLSHIENDKTSDDYEVDDNFPRETLMEIDTRDEPWFADFANYLAEAQALPTKDVRVVIPFLKKLFCRFEMPKALISDRGTYFYNKIMENTMKRYGVNNRFSTSKLDDALWAFRTAFKTATGTTPYKLIYEKDCHMSFEIEKCAYWALKNCNPYLIAVGEKRMFQLHEFDELRHQVYENSRLYKARTNVWHHRKLKMRKEFKHGNKVLRFHSKYKFKQLKLRSRWLGPYVVKHQYSSGYVELYGKDGKTFIVIGLRLKLYHEEEDYNDQREAVTPFFLKE
ncbi:zinc finger, CCHC-type containing protein [Tanacetum coccineum]